jgi:hypothetical protein
VQGVTAGDLAVHVTCVTITSNPSLLHSCADVVEDLVLLLVLVQAAEAGRQHCAGRDCGSS